MIKYFIDSIVTESIWRLSLNHTIDKICTLQRPSFRNILFFQLNLFCKDLVSNLFSTSTIIWPFSEHHFVCNNTNCKIIDLIWMILTAKNLWSHISRSSTCITRIIISPFSGNSKVSYSCIPFLIQYDIFRFDVTMYYLIFM